jgi:hypothetical protein
MSPAPGPSVKVCRGSVPSPAATASTAAEHSGPTSSANYTSIGVSTTTTAAEDGICCTGTRSAAVSSRSASGGTGAVPPNTVPPSAAASAPVTRSRSSLTIAARVCGKRRGSAANRKCGICPRRPCTTIVRVNGLCISTVTANANCISLGCAEFVGAKPKINNTTTATG